MGDYVGKHEDATSVYDGIVAEILSDKIARTQKFLRTHEVRNNGQAVLKDKRRCYRSRKVWYFDRDFDDRFPNKGKSMYMTIRRYRDDMAESVRRSDYDAELMPEAERHVGFNAVQRIMYNADKRMREIRAEIADPEGRCDDTIVETYDDSYVIRRGDGGFQFPYPDEYYNEKATWQFYEYIIRKYGMEYANKYAKGEC